MSREMDIRMEGRVVRSHQEELARFQVVTAAEVLKWEDQLSGSPEMFFAIEQSIDTSIQNESDIPLRNPSKVGLVVKLLCGMILEITTLYCAPAKRNKNDPAHRSPMWRNSSGRS